MIVKGDKIKLKKKMGTFGHIGAICTVIDVSADGIISFRYKNKYEGCISEDVFMDYFTTFRKWTEWKNGKNGNYLIENGEPFSYQYRYNGKRIQIKHGAFKAESCCHKDDEFDLLVGLSIAMRRLIIKILTNQIKQQIETMRLNDFYNQLQMGA